MGFRSYLVLFAFTIPLGAGCDQKKPAADPVDDRATVRIPPADQLASALAIQNPVQRDDALAAVAKAAAKAGDGGVALAAVVAIANPILKDETAATAATTLAKLGKGAEATDLAKLIQNPVKRDETLLAISKL